MGRVPTKRIRQKSDGRVITINASDFDPERHEIVVASEPENAPSGPSDPDPDEETGEDAETDDAPDEDLEDVEDESDETPALAVMHRGGGRYAVVDEEGEPVSDLFDDKAEALDALRDMVGDG